MEHNLTCNNLKCRREVIEQAVITTCSHIFCVDCADGFGLTGQDQERRNCCPACNTELTDPERAAITNLNPDEDYKTIVLSGLSPKTIMECAGRALNFWAYQTSQSIYYQHHLYKTLTDRYSNLNLQFDKVVNEVNAEIDSLHGKLDTATSEREALRRKNVEIAQAYKDKSQRLLQTQELYDKVKRKAEMGHIQRAATDAIDSTLQISHDSRRALTDPNEFPESNRVPTFGQSHRLDHLGHMNTGVPRSNVPFFAEDHRWPRKGDPRQSDIPNASTGSSTHQRTNAPSMFRPLNIPGLIGTPGPSSTAARRNLATNTPSFANNRSGLSGVGLTSGLKVSQPANTAGLDTLTRSH